MEIRPNVTHKIVNRAENTLFGYQGWPSIARDENGTLYAVCSTFSADGGLTWTVPECIGVYGLPPHLLLHSSGALICAFGRRVAPMGERVVVSYDLGKTWDDEYIVDERSSDYDLGYPATVELGDGSLLTVYYQKYGNDSYTSILSTRWRLKEQ